MQDLHTDCDATWGDDAYGYSVICAMETATTIDFVPGSHEMLRGLFAGEQTGGTHLPLSAVKIHIPLNCVFIFRQAALNPRWIDIYVGID